MAILTGILTLLTGCGVLMIGMKMLSDGLESSAGPGMRKLFAKISGNRFSGVGVGALVTALIQSSAATTVMSIGLVNAGIITLLQAAAIVMGANIGTTVTGLIVSLSAYNITMYLMVLAFIGVMMMFVKRDIIKKIGGALCGLALIFVGLDLMSGALASPEISQMFSKLFVAIDFPILLILVGLVFTAVIQSSSAATGILITLVGSGALGVENALFIVLGTNIGTCITAILASIGASTNAKRTALFHLMFNVVGTFIFTVFLWIFSSQIAALLQKMFGAPQMQLAMFHVFFNVITTAILLPFIKQFTKLAEILIKDKKEDEAQNYKVKFIDDRLLQTPPIAMQQLKNEIVFMADLAKTNLELSMDALINGNLSLKHDITDREGYINFENHSIAKYLIKLSALSLSDTDESIIGSYHHVINDIERIGDHAENFSDQALSNHNIGIEFSPEALSELLRMQNKVMEMFSLSIKVFAKKDYSVLERLSGMENEVDQMKKEFNDNHIERLKRGECEVERGTYFFSIITALERIGDHLINIAYSIKNPTGSQNRLKAAAAKKSAKATTQNKK